MRTKWLIFAAANLRPVPDAIYAELRLAGIYDLLEPDRPDLEPYVAIANESGARHVLDVGCGTGTFACLLAQHGIEVTGVDPAAASLDVARKKPFSDRVRWVLGDAAGDLETKVDLVTMTGNVAQVFLTEDAWSSTLRASHNVLGSGGHLVFEVRDPDAKGWRVWTRNQTYRRLELPDTGVINMWTDLIEVALPLVTFRQTFIFDSDGTTLVSESTLCFRRKIEIVKSLVDAGFVVDEVRSAADRPGLELVFIASCAG
jgi:SAM-dependent methyltransferase